MKRGGQAVLIVARQHISGVGSFALYFTTRNLDMVKRHLLFWLDVLAVYASFELALPFFLLVWLGIIIIYTA